MSLQARASRPKHSYLSYRMIDAALRHALRALPISSWTEQIALRWGYWFRPAPRVVTLRSGARIQVEAADYLQLLVYYLGTFEPHCLRYLRSCAGEGATIVDVGANIGVYTLESSLAVGPSGRVIAIEAAPSHAEALRRNIQLNGMTNIVPIQVAVGDSAGMATLTLAGGGNLGMFTLGASSGEEVCRVAVRPIDSLLEERGISSVDLIKMDVEGSEYRALKGTAKTLETCRPALLIELNEGALQSCQSSAEQVKSFLRGLGYRGWVLGRKAVQPIPENGSNHHCDECLFVHRQNASLIRKLALP